MPKMIASFTSRFRERCRVRRYSPMMQPRWPPAPVTLLRKPGFENSDQHFRGATTMDYVDFLLILQVEERQAA